MSVRRGDKVRRDSDGETGVAVSGETPLGCGPCVSIKWDRTRKVSTVNAVLLTVTERAKNERIAG